MIIKKVKHRKNKKNKKKNKVEFTVEMSSNLITGLGALVGGGILLLSAFMSQEKLDNLKNLKNVTPKQPRMKKIKPKTSKKSS